jgi:hypothetical protein
VARIERGKRILEHDLAVTTEAPPGRAADPVDAIERLQLGQPEPLGLAAALFGGGEDPVQIVPCRVRQAEIDGAAGRVGQAADAAAQRGLAAAAFAHQAEGLAAADVKAHPIDGAHLPHHPAKRALLDRKVFLQPAHAQHEVGGGGGTLRRNAPGCRDHRVLRK